MTRGENFVRTPNLRVVRSTVKLLRILMCQIVQGAEDISRLIQRFLAFSLRGLQHQSLMDDQGEVHRRRMDAVVDETLGNIQG